jgi:hypothetical protein
MNPTMYRRSRRVSSFSYGLPSAAIVILLASTWSGCSGAEPHGLDVSTDGEAEFGIITPPSEEICDGYDNDEDGEVDEEDPAIGAACDSGQLGICAAGTYVCELGGYLACAPHLSPQVEDCSTPEDEDCNGFGGCVGGGAHLWSRAFQGAGQQTGIGIAHDGAGNTYVVGDFFDVVDFGTGPRTATASDGVIVKLDASGNTIWVRHIVDTGQGRASKVAVKPSGNIVVTGSYSGFADFGFGQVRSHWDRRDLYVLELDPSGSSVWARTFTGPGEDETSAVAVDASGNTYVTGRAEASIEFGTGLLLGSKDGFLVKLDPSGNTAWAKRFTGAGESISDTPIVAPSGDVYIAALVYQGEIDFGTGLIALPQGHSYDSFLVRFDPAGNVHSMRQFGGASSQHLRGIALDSSGNILIAGEFFGDFDPGGGNMYTVGGNDGFVVKLDPSYNVIWQKQLIGPYSQYARNVLVDGADNVLVLSYFYESIDFGGGGGVPSVGAGDIYVVKYDSAGGLLWNRTFGGASDDFVNAATTDAAGNVYITGGFYPGAISFGGSTFTNAQSFTDAYVAKLAP